MIVFFKPSARSPRLGEIIYFLLPDRFNDGDPSNNRGEWRLTDPEETGFDPANPDLFPWRRFARDYCKLDYLRDLGSYLDLDESDLPKSRGTELRGWVHRLKQGIMATGFWILRM